MPSIEVILEEADGVKRLKLLLHNASIVEHKGTLVPGCTLDKHQALAVAATLARGSNELEN